jgi:hypothetical protein
MARTRRSTKESSKEQQLDSVPVVTIPEPKKPSPSQVSAGDMRQVLDRHANAIELAEKHTDNVLRYLLSLTLDQKTKAIMASTLPMCIDWIHCLSLIPRYADSYPDYRLHRHENARSGAI